MTKAKKDRGATDRSLIVFVKNPELGKVKTRLAQSVGDEKALAIYKRLLDHTRHVVTRINAVRHVFYHEEIKEDNWSKDDYTKHLQSSGDLGAKMKSAFDLVLLSDEKAIIIGSDCAQLSTDIISSAYKALSYHDVVIGPTLDGGYYLLGMNALHPELFDNMTWSVSSVYEETLSRIEKLNLTVAKLQTLSDIDHIEDWEQYGLD